VLRFRLMVKRGPCNGLKHQKEKKNADYRHREYLTEAEVDKLLAFAGDSRNPIRDRLLILMAFRHALRVSELVDLRWQQVHLDSATIDIRRAKNGTPGIHGLQGDELRLLRALRAESASIRRRRPEAHRTAWRGG
jgi:type 1 fimbriae regulatory protein FimB/type 1 fimbriae regulatory protein FimE